MLELSVYDNLLLTSLSFFTAMMTSIAGAGGGTVLLAAMLQFMNPSEAIPVHGVIQFTSNIARTWLLRKFVKWSIICLLYTSPSPRDGLLSRMPSSA